MCYFGFPLLLCCIYIFLLKYLILFVSSYTMFDVWCQHPLHSSMKLLTKYTLLHFYFISDINECESSSWNDCSLKAYCINLEGRYNCSCSTGYLDISGDPSYPGRSCAGLYVFSLYNIIDIIPYFTDDRSIFFSLNTLASTYCPHRPIQGWSLNKFSIKMTFLFTVYLYFAVGFFF